ncbi:MAG: response regulator [Planctomycetes bacterium]|nr:response regulator [Planctomycetota bacterium]MCH9725721.1 response regulator [Planctomycetota bacterium]MCH9777776.1 response regulator [Planctomycetota bacterium]MCH9792801.1 response regulator [Planctomycetota bacterium]MDF1743734.1 response regulator [Gimesia sp.]
MVPLVYVCDDDSHIVRAISMKLKKADLEVECFPDGLACWERIQDRAPNMVITDLQMPRMNGLELCEKIRDFTDSQSIPVTLLTGKGFEFDHDEYIETLKITNVMVKPFSPKKLLAQVQENLNFTHDLIG